MAQVNKTAGGADAPAVFPELQTKAQADTNYLRIMYMLARIEAKVDSLKPPPAAEPFLCKAPQTVNALPETCQGAAAVDTPENVLEHAISSADKQTLAQVAFQNQVREDFTEIWLVLREISLR